MYPYLNYAVGVKLLVAICVCPVIDGGVGIIGGTVVDDTPVEVDGILVEVDDTLVEVDGILDVVVNMLVEVDGTLDVVDGRLDDEMDGPATITAGFWTTGAVAFWVSDIIFVFGEDQKISRFIFSGYDNGLTSSHK